MKLNHGPPQILKRLLAEICADDADRICVIAYLAPSRWILQCPVEW